MSDRDHLDFFALFSIHHKVRKSAQRDATGAVLSSHAGNRATDPWMTQDQIENLANFREKSRAQLPSLHLVPSHYSA
jgi:hypothetical protein